MSNPLDEEIEPNKCELNRVFPCLSKAPQRASHIIRYADCDCDETDDGYRATRYVCSDCLAFIYNRPFVDCCCGVVYVPARRVFEQVVELPT